MVATVGLVGLRPAPSLVHRVTSPPYDVIKPGSALWKLLEAEPLSLFHIILGSEPAAAFERLRGAGALVPDDEPAYYVYEQRYLGPDGREETRLGVFVAAEVTPYEARQVIRHEKTFDDKVKGRIALARATGHTFGPVFALTRAPLKAVLERCVEGAPVYELTTDLKGLNDLHGIRSRIFRVSEASELGGAIQRVLATDPFYIADGHHRYHAALRGGQTHTLIYITSTAKIQAYDRVVRGKVPWSEAKARLSLEPVSAFATPEKHCFRIYARDGVWEAKAKEVPGDVVGRLDCKILEREVYPHLGLDHSMIADTRHFDYYPESQLVVDRGEYEIAIALHPVTIDELVAVADAGLGDPDIVMPEKSTFFAPKILSGLFVFRHGLR